MVSVFIDTSHLVAILDRSDRLHALAVNVARQLAASGASFVTSDAVIVEVLTYFSGWGQEARLSVVEHVRTLRGSNVTIVPHTAELIDLAMELYQQRPDKSYSMTDCISMVICRARGISDVLTYDQDFVREGFVALLRR